MNHQSITLRIHNDDIKRLAKAKFGFITARHMSKYTNAVEKLMNYFDEKENDKSIKKMFFNDARANYKKLTV